MPSLWDLLCVCRRKYTTLRNRHKQNRGKDSKTQTWDKEKKKKKKAQSQDPPDTKQSPHSPYLLHGQGPPYLFDSLPWYKRERNRAKPPPPRDTVRTIQNGEDCVLTGLRQKPSYGLPGDSRSQTCPYVLVMTHQRLYTSPVAASPQREHVTKEEPRVERGKRRHVRDVFSPQDQERSSLNASTVSLTSSVAAGSNRYQRRCRVTSAGEQRESMHQYTPRSVTDDAVSAMLLGNRVDDFVHDPSWNQAMDRFAASPTTLSDVLGNSKECASSETSSCLSHRRSEPVLRGQSRSDFPVSQTGFVRHGSQTSSTSPTPDLSPMYCADQQRADNAAPPPDYDEESSGIHMDSTLPTGRRQSLSHWQCQSGPEVDEDNVFSAYADVLY